MMKIYFRFLSVVVGFLLISSAAMSQGKDMYYWAGGTKHMIDFDSTEAVLNLSPSEFSTFQSRGPQKKAGRRDQNTLVITKHLSKREKIQMRSRVGYSFKSRQSSSGPSYLTDEISIKVKNKSGIRYLENKYGLTLLRETSYGSQVFKTNDWSKTLSIANTIYETEKNYVTWSYPNFLMTIQFNSDPLYGDQYYLNNTGQFGGTAGIDINAPEAWAITKGCNNIRVAVVDQGVDAHEEFGSRLQSGFTIGPTNNFGAPINGNDKNHGVACAGIIAAGHNGVGIQGIAPNSLIIPINISPDGDDITSTTENIAGAIDWAWNQGHADIINCSWNSAPNDDLSFAFQRARRMGRNGKGSVIVASSGNHGLAQVEYPASLDSVLTVGAIKNNGDPWNFSNRGDDMDLVAPVGDGGLAEMVSTDREDNGATVLGWETGKYTHHFSGTSAAAPQVSGVAALILSINPNLKHWEVAAILTSTAIDQGTSGRDDTFGFGRLNAQAAVNAAVTSLNWSMTGFSLVCSQVRPGNGTTFTMVGVPASATIVWSKSSNLTEVSGQGTTAYKVKANSTTTSGAGSVTANITFCDGTTGTVITYPTWVGRPYPFGVTGPLSVTAGSTNTYGITLAVGQPSFTTQGVNLTSGFTWTFGLPSTSAGWNCYGCYGQSTSVTAGSQSTYVTGNVANSCGTTTNDYPVHVQNPNCPPGGCEEPFIVYPNPTSEELMVAPASGNDTSVAVQLSNSNGDTIYKMESFGKDAVKIPVSQYTNGTYYLQVTKDKKTTRHQIVIKH